MFCYNMNVVRKKRFLLTPCNIVLQVNTLKSYDMHTHLTLFDNAQCEIH